MKNNMIKKIGSMVISLVVVLSIYFFGVSNRESTSLGNIGGQAYNSTSTDQFGAVTVGASKILKTGPGTLGSVIITNETAGSFNLYDATSTNHGNHATTTLMKVYANLAEGTYTVDGAFSRGLLVEFQSTNVASSTITWE